MSKIVSPYPPYEGEITPAPRVQWWRMNLPMNEDQWYLITETNDEQSWVTVEFFDGYDAVIDTGFDKPTQVRVNSAWEDRFIDVLHDGRPTPSELWQAITDPGVVKHPDDPNEDQS